MSDLLGHTSVSRAESDLPWLDQRFLQHHRVYCSCERFPFEIFEIKLAVPLYVVTLGPLLRRLAALGLIRVIYAMVEEGQCMWVMSSSTCRIKGSNLV